MLGSIVGGELTRTQMAYTRRARFFKKLGMIGAHFALVPLINGECNRKIGGVTKVSITCVLFHLFSMTAHRRVSVEYMIAAQIGTTPRMSICSAFSLALAGVGAAAFGARKAK